MTYAEVLLPLAVNVSFTYHVPEEYENKIGVGYRVIVPLGRRNKFYTGIVLSLRTEKPEGNYDIKDIVLVPDEYPIIIHPQLKLWSWIADYYLCSEGEVYKAAVPAGLKLESETYVEVNEELSEGTDNDDLTEREKIILTSLSIKGRLTIAELQKQTGLNVAPIVSSLVDRHLVLISEKLQERYRTKKEIFIKFHQDNPTDNIEELFLKVKGAASQEKLLMFLIDLHNRRTKIGKTAEISRKELLEATGVGIAALEGLIKKGLVIKFKKEINRFTPLTINRQGLPVLSQYQQKALNEIESSFKSNTTVLLRGVTSSGKTEIYQHLISETLEMGCQALMLVPEIALTTQLTRRMQAVFGDKVVIYHSKFSDADRTEIWLRLVKEKKPCLIIGARSSVFLPFTNLRLVIVDEEHESSYKQVDPAPRYNARDVAIVLASMHGAKTLLGSATPAIETFSKAKTGKFGLVELLKRYHETPLPPVETVNMTEAYKNKSVAGGFALKTLKYIKEEVDDGKQAIVFLNRRGFAPIARCRQCAWSPRCEQCDVALTYHKNINSLVCHYCGNNYPVPEVCPQCKEPDVDVVGFGTERIEEEMEMRMPEARIARMDLDTTRNKDSYSKLIDDFSAHKSDILVGTQMVTKGLDFEDVSAVVVLNSDTLINMPDFRASERAYNMLEQVAGRAGRREESLGKVIIQTFDPSNPLFGFIKNHDYEGYYNHEIEERRNFLYPPFSRIVNIYLKHRERETVEKIARELASILRKSIGESVLGPDEPSVARVQNQYIRRIMLKLDPSSSLKKVKSYLREIQLYMHKTHEMKNITVYYDVDPF